jgi:predicted branched-subunit amino acid permease
MVDNNARLAALVKGGGSMLPFTVTAFTNGVLGGVLAVAGGMSPAVTLFMAVTLNSGSAQFVATKMFQEGVPFLTIAFAVLIVSLRLLVYSAEMRSYVKGASLGWRLWLGFSLIDAIFFTVKEVYGKKQNQGQSQVLWFCLGSSVTMLFIWTASTALGVGLGRVMNQYIVFGLDLPILAMFVTMLVGAVSKLRHVVAVLLAGTSAVYFRELPYNSGLMVSAFIGAGAGIAFQYFSTSRTAIDGQH